MVSILLLYYYCILVSIHQTLARQGWYVPGKNVSWQYQLSDSGDVTYIPGVELYVIDIDSARDFIPFIRKKDPNARVVCYFSAGSFEAYRVKADEDRGTYSFSKGYWGSSSIGHAMDGWPGEYWVDIRKKRVRYAAKKRMQFAKSIGCSGVDPDNVDGYTFGRQNTGFDLTRQDQISFNTYLAKSAHSLGLGIGLKNAVELLKDIASQYDWFINESCFTFRECSEYSIRKAPGTRGKAILIVEYCDAKKELGEPTQDPGCYCGISIQQGYNTLIKMADLNAPRMTCDAFCRQNPTVCLAKTRLQMKKNKNNKSSDVSCRSKQRDECGTVMNTT